MSAALVTFLIELHGEQDHLVDKALRALNWQPGATGAPEVTVPEETAEPPPEDGRERPETLADFVHFMSMLVLPRDNEGKDRRAWLLIEVCADGGAALLPGRLAWALPDTFASVLEALGEDTLITSGVGPERVTLAKSREALTRFLARRVMPMGTSLFAQPGLRFVGTPGQSVQRIRDEARLARRVRELLRDPELPAGTALAKLVFVRRQIFEEPGLKSALFSEPVPLLAPKLTKLELVRSLAWAACRDYLWILFPLPLLVGLLAGVGWHYDLGGAVGRGLLTLGAELVLLGLAVGLGYRQLRQQEDADDPLDLEPDCHAVRRLMEQENLRGVAQNHLSAQSRLKPGWARRCALQLALWAVVELTQARSTPGFLNTIGTIHFARWYLVPGTDRLVFLSNYDGSWQSYLEDFIARLRSGLSSVWSNTRDFPKTTRLVNGGAADGARFKRWARRQQLVTPVWFSAYPRLTAGSIRTNAAIRNGLASASTEAQAGKWLARLGHSAPESLDRNEVTTLAFGGLARLRHAHAIVVRLQGAPAGARAWLRRVQDQLSYGDHSGLGSALVLAFTATGLDKLGLSQDVRKTFPTAFQQGMADPCRARLLGDDDPQDTTDGRWGMDGEPVDMLCLVCAETPAEFKKRLDELQRDLDEHGHERVRGVTMATLPEKASGERRTYEAFGFRDGLSQPIVRGTKDWWAPEKAQHVVEPGEFVLGYHDNLGKRAPTPHAHGVDYGRNGTFLVVRHLAQDRKAFDDFVATQVDRLAKGGQLGDVPRRDAPQWVAAKMVGRWRDGEPLVRQPQRPSPVAVVNPDNDFHYGREDPEGLRCPLGAHIRRANPRDSLDPGSKVQLAISNRHRILRVGRRLVAQDGQKPGLFFMCLNADIERQFEFLQQTWLLGPNFHGLDNEVDPLLGPGGEGQAMSVPGVAGPTRLEGLPRFVETLGGGYFFIPGRACIDLLATEPSVPPEAVG